MANHYPHQPDTVIKCTSRECGYMMDEILFDDQDNPDVCPRCGFPLAPYCLDCCGTGEVAFMEQMNDGSGCYAPTGSEPCLCQKDPFNIPTFPHD